MPVISLVPYKVGGSLEFGIHTITEEQFTAGVATKKNWDNGVTFSFIGVKSNATMTTDSYIGTEATINGVTGYLRVNRDDYAPGGAKLRCAFYQSKDNYNDPYFVEYFTDYSCIVFPQPITIADSERGFWTGDQIYITDTDIRTL